MAFKKYKSHFFCCLNFRIMKKRNIYPFRPDNLIPLFAWIFYLFINVIFCVKYNPFESINSLWIILGYPLAALGIYKITTINRLQQKNFFFLLLVLFILILSAFLLIYIDPYSVDVDRWSALAFWSENLKNGQFPYGTPTHMGGHASPYPVWQLFHFPFHLLGDTGYGQIFCLLAFFIYLFCQRTRMNIGGFILLLAISPAFWWEISVRSDLLCNMLLIFIFLSAHFFYSDYWKKHKYLAGLIVGLFLCTKMLVAIPLFLYFFSRFLKYTTKEKIGFALLVVVGLAVPFLPFLFGENSILNHPEYNPVLVQTRQGNIFVVIVGFLLILWSSLSWKKMQKCFFLCGLFLFALIFTVGTRIYLSQNCGLNCILFGDDELDISYFNVSMPFFLYCIGEVRKYQTRY